MSAEYEVDNPEIKDTMTGIAGIIKNSLPEGWGFTMFLFTYGENGSMFYISSAQRADMLHALAEFMEREKGKADA